MIKILERSGGNVIGYQAIGKITEEDMDTCIKYTDEIIKKYSRISWLYIMTDFKGGTWRAIYEDMIWLFKNLKHFDRMAVVGNKKWHELMIKADGLIFGEKYFDISLLEEAWKYVEGKE
ncbi:MAG TPA: STAS/SEC14 domain-containing protein [Phycisphaerae bacterium]|nr:STAS/SEC14 domain-containing protein [Phycisphaerae bacterium]HPS52357.1 STAS/SEC14 domain-containing protein [Phycisphaerae bacterium]